MNTVSTAPPTLAATARLYVGQREKPGNSGFHDADFEARMRAIGWKTGWAYCALGTKLAAKEAGFPEWCVKLISAGAVQTFRNFKRLGLTGTEIRPDSIAIWQLYANGVPVLRNGMYPGHAGIPIPERVSDKAFECIEGNTNLAGSREGDGFYVKTRGYGWKVNNGLRLLGYCYLSREEQPPKKVAA